MSNELSKYIGDNKALKYTDTVMYRCNKCGACCVNSAVILKPTDLARISKHLDIDINSVIGKYCTVYLGKDSKLPLVQLSCDDEDRCIFLNSSNQCTIFDSRPNTCRTFPIGFYQEVKSNNEIKFFKTSAPCPKDEEHFIAEIVSQGILSEFKVWNDCILKLTKCLSKWQSETDKLDVLDSTLSYALFVGLYLKYDLNKDILEQLVSNVDELVEIFN